MATVKGPLFSLGAVGSISKTLCYRQSPRGTVCRKYAKPTGLPSSDQVEVRDFTGERMNHWPLISAEDQASWFLLALEQNIEPINAYLKFNWERKKQGLETTDVYPPIELPAVPFVIATNGGDDPNPDLTGIFLEAGDYASNKYYYRAAPTPAFIYRPHADWLISTTLGSMGPNLFYLIGANIAGRYSRIGSYTGHINVSAIQ